MSTMNKKINQQYSSATFFFGATFAQIWVLLFGTRSYFVYLWFGLTLLYLIRAYYYERKEYLRRKFLIELLSDPQEPPNYIVLRGDEEWLG